MKLFIPTLGLFPVIWLECDCSMEDCSVLTCLPSPDFSVDLGKCFEDLIYVILYKQLETAAVYPLLCLYPTHLKMALIYYQKPSLE